MCIRDRTYTDDLHLEEMGEKKIALFCCIPDSDKSLNYLVAVSYTHLDVYKRQALSPSTALITPSTMLSMRKNLPVPKTENRWKEKSIRLSIKTSQNLSLIHI